jgi:threonine synthase
MTNADRADLPGQPGAGPDAADGGPGPMPYVCQSCGAGYGDEDLRWRCDCGGVLDFRMPAARVADFRPAASGVWRYASLLPRAAVAARISIGEHATPLVISERLGVLLKLDHLMPSGSYKDRGAAVLASRLSGLGVREIVLDSSGNAGAAMSTYCAAAGIAPTVFVPAGNSPMKLAQSVALGARLRPVPGPRRAATEAAREAAADSFYASHNWSPDFGAGLATLALEIWEQLGGRAPSAVLAPCGNGGIVLGLATGFDALLRGGLIERLPRLVAVQSAAFGSVADALARGLDQPERLSAGAGTIAEGIACELPVRGAQVLAAIRASDGAAITVTDQEITDAALALAAGGFYAEPTGAVGYAGLRALRGKDGTSALLGESPVVIISGSGLKSGRALADLRDPSWWPAGS